MKIESIIKNAMKLFVLLSVALVVIWVLSGLCDNVVDDIEIDKNGVHAIELATPTETHTDSRYEVFNGDEYNIPISSQMGLNQHPVMVFEPDELDGEILENRNGAIIIEMLISRIDNVKNGDATVLNTSSKFNYINVSEYLSNSDADVGDFVLTYCIYNPNTSYVDDIIMRFDYPLGG